MRHSIMKLSGEAEQIQSDLVNVDRKVARRVLQTILRALSWIVPKKKRFWVFYPTHYRVNRFQGNIKSLFAHTLAHEIDIHPYCIGAHKQKARTRAPFARLLSQCRYTLQIIWKLARAEVVIVDSGWPQKGRFRVVQLWHGTGFKNIGVMQHINNRDMKGIQGTVDASRNTILAIASSEEDMHRKKMSFLTPNVYVTGNPRNDALLTQSNDDLRKKLGLPSERTVVSYMPTLRDVGDFDPFTSTFWNRLDRLAETHGFVLVIKEHPHVAERLQVPAGARSVFDATHLVDDVQELLAVTDILVTDYSSVVTDFVLLERPVIFYTFDIDRYLRTCRDFYYDLRTTLPGPFAQTEAELLHYVSDTTWFNDPTYRARYAVFADRFQQYRDGNSSKRVVSQLRRLLYGS